MATLTFEYTSGADAAACARTLGNLLHAIADELPNLPSGSGAALELNCNHQGNHASRRPGTVSIPLETLRQLESEAVAA